MNSILTIAKRDFRSYFDSPIAYIFITAFLLNSGIMVFLADDFLEANEATLRPLFEWLPLLFAFYLPAISMRLLSEEKRSGTIELLATMPVRDAEIIIGKYLASLAFLAVILLLTVGFPIIVADLGDPDWGPIFGGYLGLFLIGAVYLAIGLMASSWTRTQTIAFVVSLLLCGFLYFVDKLLGAVWEGTQEFFAYLSFAEHFENISRGVIDTRDVIYYLSLILICGFIATFSLHTRRWRG